MDYESLGRYTEAHEKALRLLTERDSLLGLLNTMTSSVNYSSTHIFTHKLDIKTMNGMMEKLGDTEIELIDAVNTVNLYADKCGKSKLKLG